MQQNLSLKLLDNTFCTQIVDLILPIQTIEFNVPVTLADQPDLLDIESKYHQSGGGFWGAFIDDKLVGSIALISIGHNAGAIRKMFVKKEYRGKEHGIAQQLLDILINYSNSINITDLYLGTVDLLKAAMRFYERNGFCCIERSALPAYFPIMAADNVFYHLLLKKEASECY
jgi:N-acetylglutamate synthase-like GNAT family acetyltransferase